MSMNKKNAGERRKAPLDDENKKEIRLCLCTFSYHFCNVIKYNQASVQNSLLLRTYTAD